MVWWWRNAKASDLRSGVDPVPVSTDQVIARFTSRSGRGCVTTLGKLFTPACLDADSLRCSASM